MWELPPEVSEHQNIVSGIWKFSPNISVETLVGIAKEWAAKDDQSRYLDLHIRGCGKGSNGIGFKYLLADGERQKDFLHRISDKLKRAYGNDLLGWDLSSPTIIVVHHARYALAESNGIAYVDPQIVYKDAIGEVKASPANGSYQTSFYVTDVRRRAQLHTVLAGPEEEYRRGGTPFIERPFFSVYHRFPDCRIEQMVNDKTGVRFLPQNPDDISDNK